MYKVKLNVFTASTMFQILQITSTEGLQIKKLRTVNKILDLLEECLDRVGKYSLLKSGALAENMLKRLLYKAIAAKKEDRKSIIESFLSNDKNYDFNIEEDDVKYIFEDMLFSEIRRKHWTDPKVPKIDLFVTKKELEYLEEAFSDEVKFPEESAHLIVAIADAIEEAEKSDEK